MTFRFFSSQVEDRATPARQWTTIENCLDVDTNSPMLVKRRGKVEVEAKHF